MLADVRAKPDLDPVAAVTAAIANTLEKWDFSYRKLKPTLLDEGCEKVRKAKRGNWGR